MTAPKDRPISLRNERAKRTRATSEPAKGPGYPATRMRRNRRAGWSRSLVRETTLASADLIWPIFLIEGRSLPTPVASMPGVERLSVDLAVKAAEEARALGIPALALFPNTEPSLRDEAASEAVNPGNLVCRAVRAIKQAVPEIGVICDVALDPYTSHGHDGLLIGGEIDNDRTVEILIQQDRKSTRLNSS